MRAGLGASWKPTAMSAGFRPMRSGPSVPRQPTRSPVRAHFAFWGPVIRLRPAAVFPMRARASSVPRAVSLPMGARVAVARQDERFAVTALGWHIPEVYLAPVKVRQPDFVAVAERFVGTPYLWGGKTSLGLDCSALVQISMQAAVLSCPRDSDMQELALGKFSSLASLRRGDLVFWKGHVAIAIDPDTLLHANAHHMMVAIEPTDDAIMRI